MRQKRLRGVLYVELLLGLVSVILATSSMVLWYCTDCDESVTRGNAIGVVVFVFIASVMDLLAVVLSIWAFHRHARKEKERDRERSSLPSSNDEEEESYTVHHYEATVFETEGCWGTFPYFLLTILRELLPACGLVANLFKSSDQEYCVRDRESHDTWETHNCDTISILRKVCTPYIGIWTLAVFYLCLVTVLGSAFGLGNDDQALKLVRTSRHYSFWCRDAMGLAITLVANPSETWIVFALLGVEDFIALSSDCVC